MFIEVHREYDKKPVLINTDYIRNIYDDEEGNTLIDLCRDDEEAEKLEDNGPEENFCRFYTLETYDHIKAMIWRQESR